MATFHRLRHPGASLAQRPTLRNTKFEPIPAQFTQGRNAPFRIDLGKVLTTDEIQEITHAGSMAFHCMGDTGDVKDPESQKLVERGLAINQNRIYLLFDKNNQLRDLRNRSAFQCLERRLSIYH